MIKMIRVHEAIQFPSGTATSCWNITIHGGISKPERCPQGIELHWGKTIDGVWKPTGMVKTLCWSNIMDFDEDRPQGKEQKKSCLSG